MRFKQNLNYDIQNINIPSYLEIPNKDFGG